MKFRSLVGALGLIFVFVATAEAGLITFEEELDIDQPICLAGNHTTQGPCTGTFDGAPSSHEYEHDVTTDGFQSSDLITGFVLAITILDDGDSGTGANADNLVIRVYLDGHTLFSLAAISPNSTAVTYSFDQDAFESALTPSQFFDVFVQLQNFGTMNVKVEASRTSSQNAPSDFTLVSSLLTVTAERSNGTDPTPVPEPGALALLGIGLSLGGLGFLRRRRGA